MKCFKCGRKFFRPSEHDEDICADMALDRCTSCPDCGTETAAHETWCQYYEDGVESDEDEIDDSSF